MTDKRMDLLALLSLGPEHAARIGLLAADLGVSRRETKRLIAQLQARQFLVIYNEGRVWVDWRGWPHAQRAAERTWLTMATEQSRSPYKADNR